MDNALIRQAVDGIFDEIVGVRRHLHAYPELSYQEHQTVQYLASLLDEMGVAYERKADTGLVVFVEGRNPRKKTIALRSDHDALPITEANEVPYKSKNVGVMHACGHDVHTSSLIGVLKVLHQFRDQFEGTVKFIFQPAEEQNPGGALKMIEDGVLKDPEPTVIFGQHVMPELEAGTVGLKGGKFMASSDEIQVKVVGKGGHAAMPYKNIDPILIASHLVVALQQIVSRNADPNIPSVLSFGTIHGNGANNVIPDEVTLEGTFRTFDEEWRADAHQKIERMAHGLVESMGGRCELTINKGYPSLVNDEEVTDRTRHYAIEFLGEEKVQELQLRPTAEDFAYYSQRMPSCFYRLGVANAAKGINSSLHTSTFDIDEEALKTGIGLMSYVALRELGAIGGAID